MELVEWELNQVRSKCQEQLNRENKHAAYDKSNFSRVPMLEKDTIELSTFSNTSGLHKTRGPP